MTVGYLLPTRDAVTLGRPAARPLIALGERAEALGFDAVWVGDSPLARARHDAVADARRARRAHRAGDARQRCAARRVASGAAARAGGRDLDQLSEGRLVFGLGAGFPYPETERQFEAVGVPWAGRIGRLTETIAAMRALWSAAGAPVSYSGRHVELAASRCSRRRTAAAARRCGSPAPARRRSGESGASATAGFPIRRRPTSTPKAGGESAPPPPRRDASATRPRSVRDRRPRHSRERRTGAPARRHRALLRAAARAGAIGPGDVSPARPRSLRGWLEPYVRAGARHVVLRVTDDDAERGLDVTAEAWQRSGLAGARASEHETRPRQEAR